MVLHSDVKNFSSTEKPSAEIFLETKRQTEEKFFCSLHPAARHWLPIGHPDAPEHYQCDQCSPPPARAFVARYHTQAGQGHAPNLAEHSRGSGAHQGAGGAERYQQCTPIIINYERPACPHCMCRWIVEVDQGAYPDLRCWSCKRILSSDQIEQFTRQHLPTSKRKHKGQ